MTSQMPYLFKSMDVCMNGVRAKQKEDRQKSVKSRCLRERGRGRGRDLPF